MITVYESRYNVSIE